MDTLIYGVGSRTTQVSIKWQFQGFFKNIKGYNRKTAIK